ncbi:serine/arginine-rich SC35-like splicing factor SCL28 isoform X1 [Quercus suber]|uniref:serine/arginine-rich SC35-like splicing factor SCL28 isoform X1 n=1 Tax=Quercus suber TaxID=58331 RepID=UPI000CE1C38F|nr:serine/arginine-rich SC35-like splicing factor SCL28 isoform X1 [Quercus suber]POE54818.1 serine/arginine-rich sc35-like splicing factor scl28 [Quercus suber]
MARYRSRSRSYSPRRRSRTPPRGRKRYYDDEPRDRYRDSRSYRDQRRSPAPSGLLVRNLPLDARPEDLRGPFERFGQVKDVYLPKNYYTGEPRGFGFVKYRYAEDALEAKQQLNHTIIGGREIRIVFAEENRKTPQEMRTTTRVSSDRYGGSRRRRTPPRSPRRRYRSDSRSPTPVRRDSRDHVARDDYRSPVRSRSFSRSPPPRDEREYRRSPSPRENGRSPQDERDFAPSRSLSPRGNNRSLSRSRSYSPR